MISRLHYTSLLDAEAHSSRRLQSIRADEHTSRIVLVCVPFCVSTQTHSERMSTIVLFDFRELHLAFSEEVVILSMKELVQLWRPTYRAFLSGWLIQQRGVIHAQMCACIMLHPQAKLGEDRW